MAKKQFYYNEAERLYVVEQYTVAEIASRLCLSERTVRLWKEEGDWEKKRSQFMREKQRFDEELYVFARKLMKNIQDDIDAGEKPDAGRLYTLTRILSVLTKVKEYEDTKSQTDEKNQDISADELRKLIKTIASEEIG